MKHDLAIALAPQDRTVRVERLLPGPVERVWAQLTEAEKLGRWFARFDADLGPERRVRLHFGPEITGTPAGHDSEFRVTRWEPNRAIACDWIDANDPHGASHVLFELEPRGDKVLLVITNSRLRPSDLADVGGGWTAHTAVLAARLAGETPPSLRTLAYAVEAALNARLAA